MPQVVARPIRHDELFNLLDLYTCLHEQDAVLEHNDQLRHHWDAMMQDETMHILVVEYDGVLVASCVLHCLKNLTRGGRSYALIENVVTHTSYRRKGYGRMVLDKAKQIAQEYDCYKIMLLTGRTSEHTYQFYQEAGYRNDLKTGYVLSLE